MQRYVRDLGELVPADAARMQLGLLSALRSGELDVTTETRAIALTEQLEREEGKAKAPAAEFAASAGLAVGDVFGD